MGPSAAQARRYQNKWGLLLQSSHWLTQKRRNRKINLIMKSYFDSFLLPEFYNPSKHNFKHKHLWVKKATGLGVTEFMVRIMD